MEKVYSFGFPKYGRLGHGDENYVRIPKIIETLSKVHVVEISTKGAHSAARSDQGEVWLWGSGKDGRLGTGDELNKFTPTKLDREKWMNGEKMEKVQCGFDFTASVSEGGKHVYVWGNGSMGQLAMGKGKEENGKKKNENIIKAMSPTLVKRLTKKEEEKEELEETEEKIEWMSCGMHRVCVIVTQEGKQQQKTKRLVGWGKGMWGKENKETIEWEPTHIEIPINFKQEELSQVCCGGNLTAVVASLL